jgi:hypothetical protein
MSDFKNSLAYLIANQVPAYVRDEFPQFVLFLEKYYEFLDQDGEVNNVLLNAASFSDINNTLDAFLPSFREQYLQMFPQDSLVEDRRLIKFIREFYEAKGSEESILFIFKTFFNEHVDIIYPSTYVLKPSDGIWINREKMRITTDDTISLDPFDLKGKRAKIYSHVNIGSVATFETHDITVDEVTRLAYSTVPTYELFVKHQENDVIILPGAGANARPIIVDGEIKAIAGDPAVHARVFDPGINSQVYVSDSAPYFAEDYLETTDSAVSLTYARVFIENHGFTTGDCVIYDPMEGSAIGGLIPYRQYYVKVIDSRYFQLYRDKIALQQVAAKTFVTSSNVNVSNNTITIPAHGYITGDMIVYRADSTPIGGLSDRQVYYVIKVNNNTIKLADSLIDSDPRYCLDDTYFAEDYVTLSSYNEINITSQGVGKYHAISKEYFINFTLEGSGAEQRFIDAMDASGSGYNAIPEITFISDIGATGATARAYLNDSGGIEYVSMLTGGAGYTEETTIVSFSTDTIRSFVYIDEFADKYGYVSRSITDTVDIVSISGTPNYGFLQGEVYSISESGSTGQYVFSFPDTSLNYFAGDYVQFGVDNNASVIIDSVDTQGRPTKVRIFSSGSGFEAQTFTSTITSPSGSNCVLRFSTGAITSIQEGFQNRQGMLSDVNKLQDNYYYQNYSYVLRSKVPSVNWMTMVKNTVHPAGMALFSELLLGSTLELGASFEIDRQPIHFYEFPVENLHAVETLGIDYDIAVDVIKILNDTYVAEDQHASHVGKTLSDSSDGFTEQVINNVGKGIVDVPLMGDIIDSFEVGKTLLDTSGATDDIYFGFMRTVSESTLGMSDSSTSHFDKYLDKTIDTAAPYLLGDYFAEDYITDSDIILTADDYAEIALNKNVSESISISETIPLVTYSKILTDVVVATELVNSITPLFTIPNDDPIITDIAATNYHKILVDGVSVSDTYVVSDGKNITESIPNGVNENLEIDNPGKDALDTTHTMEQVFANISKNISEIPNANDSGIINIQDYWSETYSAEAYVGREYTF